MPEATVQAQAKVNLFLRILGREESGYHRIETLYQRISLADTVVVRTAVSGRSLDCRGADAGPVESNLAFRAATGFRDAAGWPDSFAIELDKTIPVGGGLGGGSADAGAVLRALNAMAPRRLDDETLLAVARGLGADVPFLTGESPTAIGFVRGDVFAACSPPPPRDMILLVPPFGVSSRDAFGWYAASREAAGRQPDPMATPAAGIGLVAGDAALAATHSPERPGAGSPERHFSWQEIAALSGNDLQDVVVKRHPVIGTAIALLRAAGAPIAQMTGSGSTAFGVFPDGPSVGLVGVPPGFTVLHAKTATRTAPVTIA
ncbi:MAG: 4-(cytidine 5'-diphospho)-2-C-methyl-D-erythritol kinase [Gemmatimonadaceae bacterium]|nr:4-(cytidine 5'-diphospho)-2-C-methyl-D-erythritol kinase [Gemmatimonadaceae bacterium]